MIERRQAGIVGDQCGNLVQGRSAFRRGVSPVECPYPLGSPEQRAWMSGWLTGYDRRFR